MDNDRQLSHGLKKGHTHLAGYKTLGQKIKASLNYDRTKRDANVVIDIEGHLVSGDLKETRRCLKGWYTAALDRPSKPCHDSMDKQTAEM